ncbi:MAG: PEP-CTERM sorting domain-containing protein [Burkholderiales bacterium]
MHSAAQRNTLIGAAVAALMAVSLPAQSAAPVYAGHLGAGGTAAGMVSPDSGPFGTPHLWDFWTLTVPFASDPVPFSAPVTVTVRRLDANLDPVIGIWFGEESDVGNYFDMVSDALTSTWFGMGDDELPANLSSGLGGDARVSFMAALPGTYVIAVADHTFDATLGGGLSYQITASVPEPETYALMFAGLGLVGLAASRRRKSRMSA